VTPLPDDDLPNLARIIEPKLSSQARETRAPRTRSAPANGERKPAGNLPAQDRLGESSRLEPSRIPSAASSVTKEPPQGYQGRAKAWQLGAQLLLNTRRLPRPATSAPTSREASAETQVLRLAFIQPSPGRH
jgi:hypothetical protein